MEALYDSAEPMEDLDGDEEIGQEDAWTVISSFFEEKGLARQQLDSFDEFIMNTMQEIVDESADIELVPEQQHNPLHQQRGDESYTIKFGQIYLSKPTWVEPDQTTSAMFPNEARLRNLTYAAPLYLDVSRTTKNYDADGNEEIRRDAAKAAQARACWPRAAWHLPRHRPERTLDGPLWFLS